MRFLVTSVETSLRRIAKIFVDVLKFQLSRARRLTDRDHKAEQVTEASANGGDSGPQDASARQTPDYANSQRGGKRGRFFYGISVLFDIFIN